jgi:chromosome segregation ATPase
MDGRDSTYIGHSLHDAVCKKLEETIADLRTRLAEAEGRVALTQKMLSETAEERDLVYERWETAEAELANVRGGQPPPTRP